MRNLFKFLVFKSVFVIGFGDVQSLKYEDDYCENFKSKTLWLKIVRL